MYEKKLVKNTIILSLGQLFPKLLNLIILPILTNQFSKSEYGKYDLSITLSSMVLPIISLQVYQAIFRELLSEKDKKVKSSIVATSLIFLIISSIVVGAIILYFLILYKVDYLVSIIMVLSIIGEVFYTTTGQIVRGLNNNLAFSIGVVIYSAINCISICILYFYDNITVVTVIFVIFLSYFVTTLFFLYKSRNVLVCGFRFNFGLLKKLLHFSIPIIPSTISLWVVNMSDRALITYFMGVSATGLYSVATKIPNLYNSAYGIFNMAWIESASKAEDEGNAEKYYSELFSKLFCFLTGLLLLIISAMPVLYNVLIDAKFYEAYNQSIVLFFGGYVNSFVSFYGGIYLALRKTGRVAISSVLGAIINLLINSLLIKKYGLYAASISTVLSFLAICIYRAIDIKRYVKFTYKSNDIFVGVIVVLSAVCLAFFKNIYLNCFVFIIACAYNKKNLYLIKNVINKIGGVLKK